jgi:segregation and condensation protein B
VCPTNLQEAQAAIEAILFAASFPLRAEEIASAIGVDESSTRKLLRLIGDRHSSPESGVALVETGGGFIMLSRPEYAPYIERLSERQRPPSLSPASLETLAIVAYRQPVTRGEIERIRGVSPDSAISTLLERGLICEKGRKESIGRPILYGTTPDFLLYLGLSSLDDLPVLPDGEGLPADAPQGADEQDALMSPLPGLGKDGDEAGGNAHWDMPDEIDLESMFDGMSATDANCDEEDDA